MPGASVAVMPTTGSPAPATRKPSLAPERKYKCQFCNRAFSRSEHRSRHERSRKWTVKKTSKSAARSVKTDPRLTDRFFRYQGEALQVHEVSEYIRAP